VEVLRGLQKSIELNDNRVSYRSLWEILPMSFLLMLFQGLSAADALQETIALILIPATATSQAQAAPCTLTRMTG
jgi:hypothetical protein